MKSVVKLTSFGRKVYDERIVFVLLDIQGFVMKVAVHFIRS